MTTAVIIIDMLNPYDHEDADALARNVEKIVDPLAGLIGRSRARDDVRTIFVNDNYGDFAAGRDDVVARALRGRRPDLVKPVVPPDDCAFLMKVRHSAFYGTSLEYVLQRERADRVVLTGQVTEQCVLYTALDAYVRHFDLWVPRDCVAHIDPELGAAALRMMERNMRTTLVTAGSCLD